MADVLERTWKLPEGRSALDESLRTFLARVQAPEDLPLGLGASPCVLPRTGESLDLLAESLMRSVEPQRQSSDSLLLESEKPVKRQRRHRTQVLPPRLQPGAWIGEFRLLRELGRGGMGAVFEVEDAAGRRLALKVVLAADNPRRVLRLAREGQITAALNHPGILRIHAGGTSACGLPYLVYELVPGCRTLNQVSPSLSRTKLIELVRDSARALAHAHQAGVVHRDIKPENLLIDLEGRIRVADFGLAGGAGLGLERVTRDGTFLGTPPYAAPEQLLGCLAEVGPHSDVWSLGVVLYECLTGELPFLGENLRDQIRLVTQGEFLAPRAHDASIPRALEGIVLRALSQDYRDRYRDAEHFADELERFLCGQPVEAPRRFMGAGARRALRAALPAAAGLLCATLLGWQALGQPSPRLHASASRGWTAAPVLSGSVTGRGQGKLSLSVDGREVTLDASGAFEAPLELSDGTHEVILALTCEDELVSQATRRVQIDTRAPRLRWSGPEEGSVSSRPYLRVSGVVEDASSPWILVRVQGAEVGRYAPGASFEATLPLQAGENLVEVELEDAAGNTSRSRRSVWLPPAWYHELAAAARAPLPLPPGVVFGAEPGEYLHRATGTVLVWIQPPAHEELVAVSGVRGTFYLNGRTPIRISEGYFLGKFEITWGQFRAFCGETRVPLARPSFAVGDEHPVHGVTWEDACAFAQWLGGRLPSEAEWEYAAAGSESRTYPWGDSAPAGGANLAGEGDGFARTAPVGSNPRDRSALGCFDMGGNVSEWTADGYAEASRQRFQVDPRGAPESSTRVIKGGSFRSKGEASARCARRLAGELGAGLPSLGFRVLIPGPSAGRELASAR